MGCRRGAGLGGLTGGEDSLDGASYGKNLTSGVVAVARGMGGMVARSLTGPASTRPRVASKQHACNMHCMLTLPSVTTGQHAATRGVRGRNPSWKRRMPVAVALPSRLVVAYRLTLPVPDSCICSFMGENENSQTDVRGVLATIVLNMKMYAMHRRAIADRFTLLERS
jgi:hypothetical protein